MKKIILSLLFNFICQHFIFGQQNKIDSLEKALATEKKDTSKVRILCSLSDELCDMMPKKAIDYAIKGLNLAKQVNFKKGISICYNALGNGYSTVGKIEEALNCFKASLIIASKMNDSLRMAAAYDNIGIIYFQQSRIDSAIKLRNAANKIYKSLNKENLLANGYLWLGNIYNNLAQYTIALEYDFKALNILEKLNDPNIGFALANISYIYHITKDYKKAKKYAIEANSRFTQINNQYGISSSLYNLSLIYIDEGNYRKAIELLLKAKQIVERIENKDAILGIYNLLGDTFRQTEDYDQALEYLNKALIIAKQLNNLNQIANVIGNIGKVYEMQKKYSMALKYFLECEQRLDSLKDFKNLKSVLKDIVEVYSYLNLPDSSLKYFNLYQKISDTIYNEQTAKSITEMEIKYETQKKQDSLSQQEKLIAVKSRSITQQNYFLVGLATLALIIAGLFIVSRLQSKKINNQYKKIVQLQSEVMHRTGNFFNSIKGMLSVALTTTSDKETIAAIDKKVNTINHLFKTLYSSPNDQLIAFPQLLNTICDDFEHSFGNENNIQVYRKTDAAISKEETVPLAFIITELLTNSYKHAFKNIPAAEIHVQVYEEAKKRILHLWDNGDGVPENMKTPSNLQQGMGIIKGYCKTLGGKMNTWNDDGFHFKMEF